MSEQVNALLTFLLENLKETKEFVVSQAPDIMQQMILYGYYSNLLYILTCSVLMVSSIFILFKINKKVNKQDFENGESEIACVMIFFVLLAFSFASFIIMCGCINNLMLIKLAPKVYLIKEISSLIVK